MMEEIPEALPYDIGKAISEFIQKIRQTGFVARNVEIDLRSLQDSQIVITLWKPLVGKESCKLVQI